MKSEDLVIYKTDKGRFAVRPISWGYVRTKDGYLSENASGSRALFNELESAKEYIEWKNAKNENSDEPSKTYPELCISDDELSVLKEHVITGIPVKILSDGKYMELSLINRLIDEVESYRDLASSGRLLVLPRKIGEEVFCVEKSSCGLKNSSVCSEYCDGFGSSENCKFYESNYTIVKRKFQAYYPTKTFKSKDAAKRYVEELEKGFEF